jgi:asparagine synthase (glutamine-hydrolysing)
MVADFILYYLSADGRTRTFFQGIHSLPPAHMLIATQDRVVVRRYFDFDTEQRLRLPSLQDYVGRFRELFAMSVRNRIRSSRPVAISVSGGLDSSYIFCVAHQLVRETPGLCPAVLGFNYGGPPGTSSDESPYVDRLERTCDAKIERIAPRPGFMECAGAQVWGSESPSVEAMASLSQLVLQRVSASGARRLVTGQWGDQVLKDREYLVDLVRSGKWWLLRRHGRGWRVGGRQLAVQIARDLVERHAPPSLVSRVQRARARHGNGWLPTWFTPRFREVLLGRFAAPRLPRTAGSRHAWGTYQQVRLGYQLQCMEWNSRIGAMHGVDLAFPFLDCNLAQFLMSIPGEIQAPNGVQRGLMRLAMRGIVPDEIIDRHTKGEFTYLANQGVDHDFAAIRDLLGPDALSVKFGYLDGPVLWTMLEQWRTSIRTSKESVLSDRIIDLCGLELLLRRYFWNGEKGTTVGASHPSPLRN